MIFRLLPIAWSCAFILLVSGCASTPSDLAAIPGGKTIAVMPLDNQTNSVAGALYMREEMVALLKRKGYAPLPIAQTDQMLANLFGISLGGQIAEEDIPKIAAGLEVDAIMTGRLRNFGLVLLSYNEVSATFTMYSGKLWHPVWTYDGAATVPFSPLRDNHYETDIRTEIIGGFISSILERSFGRPLHDAVSRYYKQLQYSLPSGRDTVFLKEQP